jgi:hypothetical protein
MSKIKYLRMDGWMRHGWIEHTLPAQDRIGNDNRKGKRCVFNLKLTTSTNAPFFKSDR